MSAPDTKLLAYVGIVVLAANVLWLWWDDEDTPVRTAMACIGGAAWPLMVIFAGVVAAAWLITFPARKLEAAYLKWRAR